MLEVGEHNEWARAVAAIPEQDRRCERRRPLPREVWYPLLGALLSLGAPAGYLLLRSAMTGAPLTLDGVYTEIAAQSFTYAYLLIASLIGFALFGWFTGRKEDELETISATDALTGLWNRRHLRARLKEEIERATRYDSRLSLLLVDVDGLKAINDRRGHAAGDRAIRSVADGLRATCRSSDIAARYGGDEFVVVVPEADGARALDLAERIRAAVSSSGLTPPISVSIGVADLDHASRADLDSLCEAADHALYEAKAKGRNRAVLAA